MKRVLVTLPQSKQTIVLLSAHATAQARAHAPCQSKGQSRQVLPRKAASRSALTTCMAASLQVHYLLIWPILTVDLKLSRRTPHSKRQPQHMGLTPIHALAMLAYVITAATSPSHDL